MNGENIVSIYMTCTATNENVTKTIIAAMKNLLQFLLVSIYIFYLFMFLFPREWAGNGDGVIVG